MKPKISVIIPVYNGAKFISNAIRSVLAQEYPAYEIIVVDDGSTDQTPQVLAQFLGKIVTKRIENAGAAAARNTAMAMATGDFFAFLDADDLWFRNRLKRQAELIAQYPEAGFFCCNFAVRYPHLGGRLVKQYSVLQNLKELNFDSPLRKDPFELLIKEHFVGTSSAVVIKREVAEKAGSFDTNFKSTQDYEYWLRCAAVTDFVLISDVLFYKKNHPANISANVLRTQTFRRQVLENVLTKYRDHIQARGLRGTCLQALAENDYFLGNVYFDSGQRRKALQSYWEGFRIRPTPLNFCLFFWAVFKKGLRVLTFNFLSRRNLEHFR